MKPPTKKHTTVPGKVGGVIAAKGPLVGAAIKGMGHSKPAMTSIGTDRGAFKIKG